MPPVGSPPRPIWHFDPATFRYYTTHQGVRAAFETETDPETGTLTVRGCCGDPTMCFCQVFTAVEVAQQRAFPTTTALCIDAAEGHIARYLALRGGGQP